MNSSLKQYFDGAKKALPVILGFIPVGIAYAVMANEAGLTAAENVLMSMFVFAGASQIMAVGMIAQVASMVTIVTATLILNLRHIIMSTCVMNKMKNVSLAKRLIASFGVTDESFAIFTTIEEKKCTIGYFLGIITVSYSAWITGTVIGVFARNFLPAIVSNSLDIALYAMFIALLVPHLKNNLKLLILVVITATVNTLLCMAIDSGWAMIISTLVCAGIGIFIIDDKELAKDGDNASDTADGIGDVYTEGTSGSSNR